MPYRQYNRSVKKVGFGRSEKPYTTRIDAEPLVLGRCGFLNEPDAWMIGKFLMHQILGRWGIKLCFGRIEIIITANFILIII